MNICILSIVDNVVKISKTTIADIQFFLQNAQEKIGLLQLESQLQQKELQKHKHHFELVSI